jgi:hypothetical protein
MKESKKEQHVALNCIYDIPLLSQNREAGKPDAKQPMI